MFGARGDVSAFGLLFVFTRLSSTKKQLGSRRTIDCVQSFHENLRKCYFHNLTERDQAAEYKICSRSMVMAVQHPLNGFIVELSVVNSLTLAVASPYRLEISRGKASRKFIFLKLNTFFLLLSEINNHDRSLCFSHVNAYETLETVAGNEKIYDIFQFTAKEQPVEDKDRLKAKNMH